QNALGNAEFADLRIAFEDNSQPSELRFGVARNRAMLSDQLDRPLASLAPTDDAVIRARWLGANFNSPAVPAARRLILTPAEQNWLRSLPPLTVGFDNAWSPFSYLDDAGHPGGIAAEY